VLGLIRLPSVPFGGAFSVGIAPRCWLEACEAEPFESFTFGVDSDRHSSARQFRHSGPKA